MSLNKQGCLSEYLHRKAAKKPELEVPFLDELKEKDGNFYLVKNDVLRVFNFIQNKFTDKSFENFKKILDANKKTFFTIEGKIFTQEQKDILKSVNPGQRYGERVFLLK